MMSVSHVSAHVSDHVLDHVPDHVSDHMIIGLVTTALHCLHLILFAVAGLKFHHVFIYLLLPSSVLFYQ